MCKLINYTLCKPFFKRGLGEIYSIKLHINGKINGVDRARDFIFIKMSNQNVQPTFMWLFLKVTFSFIESLSRYGVFSIRV